MLNIVALPIVRKPARISALESSRSQVPQHRHSYAQMIDRTSMAKTSL